MRFSVIVPCYNIEKYISRCVDSILAQTYQDFEVILVDDGSYDGTAGILDSYLSRDDRVQVLHQKNRGVTSARKTGAGFARGDYIALVDGDDWIAPDYLATFSKIFDKHSVDVACCGYIEVYGSNKVKKCPMNAINERYGYFNRGELEKYFLPSLFSFTPALWSKVFKRSLYMQFQMLVDDKICMGEDAVVSYPILLNIKDFFLLDCCLYYYNRENLGSLTKNPGNIVSYEDVRLRVIHFEKYVLSEGYNLYAQFSEYIVCEIFYAAKTHLKNQKYKRGKKELVVFLKRKKHRDYMKHGLKSKSMRIKIIAAILYFRLILLLKLWLSIK